MAENIKISIKKEQISTMPVAAFTGQITVVETDGQARDAISHLLREQVIGFDTETKPSFQKGRTNKVALMQLSTAEHCYLFRLNKLGISPELGMLLENERLTKIGLSVHDDFNVMHRSSQVQPKGFVDLQDYVKQFGIQDISLQKIYAIIFGHKISKSQRLTNWEAASLTRQQQVYAATDAWACLEIYHHLRNGLFQPADSPYVVTDDPVDVSRQTDSPGADVTLSQSSADVTHP